MVRVRPKRRQRYSCTCPVATRLTPEFLNQSEKFLAWFRIHTVLLEPLIGGLPQEQGLVKKQGQVFLPAPTLSKNRGHPFQLLRFGTKPASHEKAVYPNETPSRPVQVPAVRTEMPHISIPPCIRNGMFAPYVRRAVAHVVVPGHDNNRCSDALDLLSGKGKILFNVCAVKGQITCADYEIRRFLVYPFHNCIPVVEEIRPFTT